MRVISITGELGTLASGNFNQMQGVKHVLGALAAYDPAAIGRPVDFAIRAYDAAIYLLVLTAGQIEQVQPPVFVDVCNEFTVG